LEKLNKNAIVLLSGGMDSATCLALALKEGLTCHSLAFDYGQRHRVELEMARRQAEAQGVREHVVVRVELDRIGPSALTTSQEVPKEEIHGEIPPTYVPARNTVFLSLGLAWAEAIGAQDLFIGANQVDYSGYPDCRGEFLEAYEKMAHLATRVGVQGGSIRIRAPLLNMDKAQIIEEGHRLGVDYRNTHTCYDPLPGDLACGRCPSCRLRLRGFEQAGLADPIEYATASSGR
jgi:7-cyano-7-deazaguanine synthase